MCPVCYGENLRLVYFPCGHGTCRICTARWFSRRDTCPTCRAHVGVTFCSDDDLERVERERERLTNLEKMGYSRSLTTNVFITECGFTKYNGRLRQEACHEG